MSLRMQPNQFVPHETIVALLGVDAEQNIKSFLGTSFFVGPSGALVTAEHVVRDWKEQFAIAVVLSDDVKVFPASLKHASRQRDLAILEVSGYKPNHLLPLSKDSRTNTDVNLLCLEYSTTETGKGNINITEPATRKGHMTRERALSGRYGEAGQFMLELSFPALKGASGAPVMKEGHPFECVGILVANVSNHLLPVQIMSVLDEKNQILEETQFLLPQALAVNVKHLIKTLHECGHNT